MYITLDKDNKVVATRTGKSIVNGEIFTSDSTVQCGMIYNEDGTFTEDTIAIESQKLEQSNQFRIVELRQSISDKKLLDIDCKEEQSELAELLGIK